MLDPARFHLAPDPDDAHRRLERLLAAGLSAQALEAAGPDAAEVVRIACTQAPYLAMLGARDPARLLAAAADPYLRREKPRERTLAEVAAAAEGASDGRDLARRLRAYRATEYVRLGARECGLGEHEEVGRELSHLADGVLEVALRFHDAELERAHGAPIYLADDGTARRAELCVMAMGKMGGEELNFSSDIDLIFVYTSDNGSAPGIGLHEYFDKLARRLTRTIGEVTEDDVVFRVDLRLRPEGSRGTLVNSLPSLERYYESWGRPWERQAWLKARPAAGDCALGEVTLAILEPFIYPRSTSADVIRDVAELNHRIKAELDGKGLGGGFDVKLGVGGIREIEFFVQALQLVHAGKNPGLRERSTRRALDRLLFAGLVAERERRQLSDAYGFLRQVEHRLQLESGRQTHRLPADLDALTVLARRLGCADAGELAARLELHTGQVASIFATLGDEADVPPAIARVLADGDRDAVAGLGFRDPVAAAFYLELLRRKPGSPFSPSATGPAAHLAPRLLAELCASPDPDQALAFAVDFVSKAGAGRGLWQLLDENRPLLRLLCCLFGTSAFLATAFVQHPELTDALLLAGSARRRPTLELPADEEAAWGALRRYKNEEVLRVGLQDIAGDLADEEVHDQLSAVADVCVQKTFDLVAARRGAASPRMAVLGLGKLGAGEMGYASDLDIVFIYDGSLEEHEAATKLAQRLVHALGASLEEGRLYQVDTRLRPSGRQGTLVSSLAAWRQYHAREAQLWERQALIRCRAVAGDAALGALVEEEAARFVYAPGLAPAAVAEAIRSMRERLEKATAGAPDVKIGPGGLLDVEFAAQYLQLVHGPALPALRVRRARHALAAAAAAGVIDEATRATLVDGHRFLRLVEDRLRIVHDRPIHEFPRDPAELDKLARRTRYPSGPGLERAYRAWTRDVRAAYERILDLPAPAC